MVLCVAVCICAPVDTKEIVIIHNAQTDNMELRTQVQVSQYKCLSLFPGHTGSIVNKGVLATGSSPSYSR